MARAHRKLAPKEDLFVAEYLISLNASDAYRKSGYKGKAVSALASQLLAKPSIQAAVAKAQAERMARTKISAADVLREIAKVGFASMRRFVLIDSDGQPQINLTKTPHDDLDALSEISTETVLERDGLGEDGQPIFSRIRKTKIKLHDKLNALEKLAQHTGVYKQRDEDTATAFAHAIAEIQSRSSRAPIRRSARSDGEAE